MEEQPLDFQIVIDALLDENRPFPAKLLYQLSAPHAEELIRLKRIWPNISLIRRRALLEDLEALAEKDSLLIYDEIGKMALRDSDSIVITNAIRLLWQVEDKRLAPLFIDFLENHADEGVRATAGNILGNFVYMGEIETIPSALHRDVEKALLKAYADDRSDLVRRRTLEALGYSSRNEVIALINSAFANKDTLWLESSLVAMGRSADNQWDRQVLQMLQHEDLSVRICAIHAAGDLAIEKSRTYLLELLEEGIEDDELLAEVIWALSQIGGPAVRETLEGLQEQLDDPDFDDIIEDALDNLSLTEDASLFELLDYDLDDEDGDYDAFLDGLDDRD